MWGLVQESIEVVQRGGDSIRVIRDHEVNHVIVFEASMYECAA